MLRFTLSISCLTTSSLPWFMDLTFQVLRQYCSLQHRTFTSSPITSTTGHCFCFGSVSSFFQELFFLYSPVAYWAPTDLGSSSFSVLSFCLFMLFMGFSRQNIKVVYNSLLQWGTFCQNSIPWLVHLRQNKGQKRFEPNGSRCQEEVTRIHRRTIQKRSLWFR